MILRNLPRYCSYTIIVELWNYTFRLISTKCVYLIGITLFFLFVEPQMIETIYIKRTNADVSTQLTRDVSTQQTRYVTTQQKQTLAFSKNETLAPANTAVSTQQTQTLAPSKHRR